VASLYLDVRLKAGERWTFHPTKARRRLDRNVPRDRDNAGYSVSMGEVAVFEDGDQAIEFEALSDAGFILGAAHQATHRPGDRPLLRAYQREFLRVGESNIAISAAAAQPGCPGARKTLRIAAISLVEDSANGGKHVGSDGVQLFQRMPGPGPGQVDRRLPLDGHTYPSTRGREIVTQQGVMIANSPSAMSEEIAGA